MGYSIGYDENHKRDIGYGVPALCDHPDCNKKIHRGLSYVCGNGEPFGGDEGCGLFFCEDHGGGRLCENCGNSSGDDDGNETFEPLKPFEPKQDTKEWIVHKLTDGSWKEWRSAHPEEVSRLKQTEE